MTFNNSRPEAAVLGVLLLLVAPRSARAVDTIETWDAGATDVELYLGIDGLGSRADVPAEALDFVLGHGIVPGISTYLSAALRLEQGPTLPTIGLSVGIFGTPLDTEHVDVDVLFELSAAGDGLREFELAPGLELNLDAAADRRAWGAYVRVLALVRGKAGRDGALDAPALAFAAGVYGMAAEDHQLLLELGVALRAFAAPGERDGEFDGVAFGYNAQLTDAIELISQLTVTPAVDGSPVVWGASIGFIATLPAAVPSAVP